MALDVVLYRLNSYEKRREEKRLLNIEKKKFTCLCYKNYNTYSYL